MLLAEGVLARPGIYLYRRADGSMLRELVPLEVLADGDWLASVGRSTVTLEHPPEMLTPENVQRFAVGDTDGDPSVDDRGFVRIKIAARTAAAIKAIQSGGKVGLSPGYTVDVDETPGVDATFGAYDSRQIRRYANNHNAICGKPRGGQTCSLRVDAYEVDPMDPRILAALRRFVNRDSMEEGEASGVLDKLLAELVSARDSVKELATVKAELADAKAKLDEYAGKEKEAVEVAAKADAIEVAKRHAVTVGDGNSASIRATIVAKLFPQVKLDSANAAGLWEAAKALPAHNNWAPVERIDGDEQSAKIIEVPNPYRPRAAE